MTVIFHEKAYLLKYSYKKIIKFCLKEHLNFSIKIKKYLGSEIIISIPQFYIGKERYVEKVMNFIRKGDIFNAN